MVPPNMMGKEFDEENIMQEEIEARRNPFKDVLNKDGSLIKNFAYNGPTFTNLSEPVQNTMLEYLYECGLRPEIGIAVEYLSWNKEQRLYMAWLRDLSFYLSNEV